MRARLEERLTELTEEFEKGQAMLRETELRRAQLEETLTRIDGAILVLRELLSEDGAEQAPDGKSTGKAASHTDTN